MIAAWMASAVVVGFLVTTAALALDGVLTALRRPVRWVWLTAIVATAAWPLVAFVLAQTNTATATVPDGVSVQRLAAFVVRVTDSGLHLSLNSVLAGAWIALTLVMGGRLVWGLGALALRRRHWNATSLDGARVWLSGGIGPAVVGLRPMEVVLPAWVAQLDRPLRGLILRHESEHVRAGDPYLLWAATIAKVLLPWNAALWMQARRLRLAVELDCDARVLRAEPNAERYGLLLLAIAQRSSAHPELVAPALIEPRLDLERRIQAMHTKPRSSRARLAVLTAVGVGAVALACSVDAPVEAATSPANANAAAERPVNTKAAAQGNEFYEFQVERVATHVRGTGGPVYPEALRNAGVGGKVIAQFVVGVDGGVELATFKVLRSTHAEFTDAVRNALPRMRFTPATVGGRAVKQLLQLPFEFGVR